MATLSKQDTYCTARLHKKSEDIEDLSYGVITVKGIQYKFYPTPEGLRECDVFPSIANQAFSREVIDNLTDRGEDTCYTTYVDND